uniref:S-adenosyl-L-methionine-dependent methyltransferase n=1 Tax=Streptomyces argenteolus TaxID=67274 RepID=A9ZNW4_9ACTN|nr:hypothetical protein [Streptomyces argenteolus]
MATDRGRSAMDPPTGIGRTAIFMAYVRLLESRRPDRLFDDSLAEAFTDAVGFGDTAAAASPSEPAREEGTQTAWLETIDQLAIRTRFFDDYLLDAVLGGIRQVVIVAAGLDTRAYRLPWPERVRLFELDLPEVLDFKEKALAGRNAIPSCDRTAVPVDLTADWPATLAATDFAPATPTAWLAEGIFPYLSEAENDALLDGIGRLSPPGSRLAAEHLASHMLHSSSARWARDGLASLGLTWKSAVDDPEAWMGHHGWHSRSHLGSDPQSGYGRRLPSESADAPRGWLIRAWRD